MNNKSFTLIELLVVIAIIGVLSAIIITSMSGAVTRSRITRLQVFSDTIRAQLSDSLVSWWPFNEGTGTTVYDKWEGNNGTLHGDPTWKYGGDCVSGDCLEFDGINDYVDCGSDSSLDITDVVTVETWVKINTFKYGGVAIIDKMISWPTGGWILYNLESVPPQIVWGISTIGGGSALGFNAIIDTWYHVIGIGGEGISQQLYINGNLVDSTSPSNVLLSAPTKSVYLGRLGIKYFDGLIDEVRIYNSAASITQIQLQYLAGLDKLLSNGAISKSEYNQRIKKLSKEIVIE